MFKTDLEKAHDKIIVSNELSDDSTQAVLKLHSLNGLHKSELKIRVENGKLVFYFENIPK